MKIIALYNHKGGVSKTTTTFNLARYMQDQGKKVLVVDADPQCNMTEFLMCNIIEHMDEEALTTGTVEDLPGTSLLDILQPRFDGEISIVDIDKIETVQTDSNIFLIRGDVALNTLDTKNLHVKEKYYWLYRYWEYTFAEKLSFTSPQFAK